MQEKLTIDEIIELFEKANSNINICMGRRNGKHELSKINIAMNQIPGLLKELKGCKAALIAADKKREAECNHKYACIRETKITPKTIKHYLKYGMFPIDALVCIKCGKLIHVTNGAADLLSAIQKKEGE